MTKCAFLLTFVCALAFESTASAQYGGGLFRNRSRQRSSAYPVQQVQAVKQVAVAQPVAVAREVQVPVTRFETREKVVQVQVPITTLETRQAVEQAKAVKVQEQKSRQRLRLRSSSRYGGC